MNLSEYLSPERVLFLRGSTKTEVIDELIDAAMSSCRIPNRSKLREEILHREELMSTGIGLGIGVPHVRLDGVTEPCLAVGVHRDGVGDYSSLDDDPIRLVVMIVAGTAQHALYIRLLATVTSLLKAAEIRQRLIASKDPQEIHAILTEAKDA